MVRVFVERRAAGVGETDPIHSARLRLAVKRFF